MLLILLSIQSGSVTTPSLADLSLLVVVAIEKFYDIMLQVNKFWFLQRISIYIALCVFGIYGGIVAWMNQRKEFDHQLHPELKVDLTTVIWLLSLRFILFLVEETLDCYMDGELHNDLLELTKVKHKDKHDPFTRYKNDFRENMMNVTKELQDLIKSAGEEQFTEVNSTITQLRELAMKHEEVLENLAKLNEVRTKNPVPNATAAETQPLIGPAASASPSSSNSAAENVPSNSNKEKIKRLICKIKSMIISLDSDFKMAPEVEYVGSFFAWGIASVYGDSKTVWRRNRLRTCFCCYKSETACNCNNYMTVIFWTIANIIRWVLTIFLLVLLSIIFVCGSLVLLIITIIFILLPSPYLIYRLVCYYIFSCCLKNNEEQEPLSEYYLFMKELFKNWWCTIKELLNI